MHDDPGETLGDWMERQIDVLRHQGLEGNALKAEIRRVFWARLRTDLSGLIKDARGMEEAWRLGADCLESEFTALMLNIPPEDYGPTRSK